MPSIERVVDPVRPARERAGVRDHRGRAGRVGAAVEQDPHADVDEPPVERRAVLGPDPGRVAVHVARERLLAAVDDLDRALGVEREHRAVDLHRQVLAAAERAADPAEVDPHLLRLEAETGRDLVAVDVQPLRGDVDVDAALAVRNGQPRLGPEERLVLRADLVDALDAHLARRVGIAVADDHRADHVRPRIVEIAVPGGRTVPGGAAPARSRAPGRRRARAARSRRRSSAAARRACSGCSAATSATASPK